MLFTVGVGLLLMGAQVGHEVFAAAGVPVPMFQGDGERPFTLPLTGNDGRLTRGDLLHPVFDAQGLPKFHDEGPAPRVHKNLYKRSRNRTGPDLFYPTFSVYSAPARMTGLPFIREEGIVRATLVAPLLRGPPCA